MKRPSTRTRTQAAETLIAVGVGNQVCRNGPQFRGRGSALARIDQDCIKFWSSAGLSRSNEVLAILCTHAGRLVAPMVTRAQSASSCRTNRCAHRRDQQSQNSNKREDICADAACADWIRFVHALRILRSTLRWCFSIVNLHCTDCPTSLMCLPLPLVPVAV